MESIEQPTEAPERTYTPEEIREQREKIKAYYKEQINFLKVEREYQFLLTEIQEFRMREIRAQIMIANAMAPPPEQPGQPEQSEASQGGVFSAEGREKNADGSIVPPRERKLKTAAHAQ